MKKNLLFLIIVCAFLGISSGLFAQKKSVVKVIKEKNSGMGWLGVKISDMDSKKAEKFNTKTEEGAFVDEVVKKSPADSAGIKDEDVIVELNSRKIYDADDLVKSVSKIAPGTKVNVIVQRKGEKKTLQVIIGNQPKHKMVVAKSFNFPFNNQMDFYTQKGGASFFMLRNRELGLEVMDLNKQLGEFFGLPDGKGVLVKEVHKKGNGEKAGFKAGDIIISINNEKIKKIHDIWDELSDMEENNKAEIEVLRKGTKVKLTIEFEKNEDTGSYFEHLDNDDENVEIEIGGLEGLDCIKGLENIKILHGNFDLKGLDKLKNLENLKELEVLKNLDKRIYIDSDNIKVELKKMKPELEKMKKELKQSMKNIKIRFNGNCCTAIEK